jgi:hypothetical protein
LPIQRYDSRSRKTLQNLQESGFIDFICKKYVSHRRPLSHGLLSIYGWAEGTPARCFELISTKAMPSGIVMNSYTFAGTLKG